MNTHFSTRFQKDIVILHPGEFFATGEDVMISTVLGSCIAVAFFDARNRIGGLNHFMLPGNLRNETFYLTESGKYGMFAMELVINEMLKLGTRRSDLTAKVFGGAHVLRTSPDGSASVPRGNVEFAFQYLKTEKITIDASDVGGTAARKIFFDPRTSKVLVKRITGALITDVAQEERKYLEKIKKDKDKPSEPTLF